MKTKYLKIGKFYVLDINCFYLYYTTKPQDHISQRAFRLFPNEVFTVISKNCAYSEMCNIGFLARNKIGYLLLHQDYDGFEKIE